MRRARRSGERGKGGCVDAGYVGYVIKVDVLEKIAILNTVFDAHILVLMVEVFAPLGKAYGGEALLIEAGVASNTQETVAPEDEDGMEGWDEVHQAAASVARRKPRVLAARSE